MRMPVQKKFILAGIVILAAIAAVLYFEKPWQKFWGAPLAAYSHPAFGVSFEYPAAWDADPAGGAFLGIPLRHIGTSGYFGVDALAAGEDVSIDSIVEQIVVRSDGAPYGTRPAIKHTELYGREARVVLPSEDQPETSNKEALLLVRYPDGRQIGDNFFRFFVLYADADHIEDIVRTLEFSE